MNFDYVAVSETGLKRSNNEDTVGVYIPDKPWLAQSMGYLAIVSDGMGGYAQGERASSLIVQLLPEKYYHSVGNPLTSLRQAAIIANNAVAEESLTNGEKMGATCTAVAIIQHALYVLHIGDSRCYTLINKKLEQITTDHTVIGEMSANGHLISPEITRAFNPHALTRAMGMQMVTQMNADVFSLNPSLNQKDKLFLCTDGVYLHLTDDEIKSILLKGESLEQIKNEIVRKVMKRGARDNFSFIIIEFNR